MFGIGFGEFAVLAIVLLIAVGPTRLPTLMKTVGKGLREFRRATRDLRESTGIDEMLRDEDYRDPLRLRPGLRPVPPKPRPTEPVAAPVTEADVPLVAPVEYRPPESATAQTAPRSDNGASPTGAEPSDPADAHKKH